MAKTPQVPPDVKTPVPTARGVAANTSKVIVSKQVFTDFAAI